MNERLMELTHEGLYYYVLAKLIEEDFTSITKIQRDFGVGFPKAERILTRLQKEGYVEKTPTQSSEHRVLIGKIDAKEEDEYDDSEFFAGAKVGNTIVNLDYSDVIAVLSNSYRDVLKAVDSIKEYVEKEWHQTARVFEALDVDTLRSLIDYASTRREAMIATDS